MDIPKRVWVVLEISCLCAVLKLVKFFDPLIYSTGV
jgi:hypothetical protein